MAYIGRQPITGQFEKQQLTADGSTTSFALNWTVGSTSALIVSVGGVLQEPDTAYTLSGGGTNIVFTAAPASGDRVYVHFLGQAITQNLTDMNGVELILDANANTSITADTDDQIDIKIGGADDFQFTANAFNVLTGSHATIADSANALFGTGSDMLLYHDGSNSYITNATGALKVATETSGIAVTIGHSTSEVTIADNLTVTGTLTLGSNAELTEAELEFLDGITAGTAAASKAVVLDANKDIGTIRNLTIDGVLTDGNYTFDTSGNVSGLGTVGSGAITSSGVITGTTVEATGDTSANDNAAIGYTSAEGLILTGQGSTNDVTIKNDADAAVIQIPTGTTNVSIAGDLTISGDDLTMATNTSGAVLVGDGTNFNPVVISGDATIAANGALTIANNSIEAAMMADNSIDSDDYVDGSIDTAHIADDQVTLAKMAGLARGKIIYGDSSGNPAALAVGSNGQALVSNGTDISWGSGGAISTYSNATNNRVVTSVDSSSVNSEANLTFDGSTLAVTGAATVSTTLGVTGILTGSNTVIGTTFEPTGDTSSGDNAAIGYTSGEGLILTGQGSTSDVTLKNDADATVFTVPTGTDDILFPDGAKAMWGNSSDFTISHDGTNTILSETGTGNLVCNAGNFKVYNAAGDETIAQFVSDAGVELFFNNSSKFTTATDGAYTTGHFYPSANDTYDLGKSGNIWRDIYTGDLNLTNIQKENGNDVDGTKGSWKIQEGSNDLFIMNQVSGKKYKFKLEEMV